MFEFKGKLSKECEDFLFYKQRKMEVISICFASVVVSIPIIIFAFSFHLAILGGGVVISYCIANFVSTF